MRATCRPLIPGAVLLLMAAGASAQNAISAKAGMINVADGEVFIIDAKGGEPQRIEPKLTEFLELKEGHLLKTTEGRAELLLTPGAFLRLGDDSSVKLYSNRLSSVRLEVTSGSALVDVAELLDGNAITLTCGGAEAVLGKAGLYRFDAAPPRIRVFNGQATVAYDGKSVNLKSGRELGASTGGWVLAKFDADKESDSLHRWSKRRSGYIAMANVSAARQASSSFLGSRGAGRGSWYWNPYFGFATYIPLYDTIRSPFGYYYYTPVTVIGVYAPQRRAPAFNSGWSGGSTGAFAGGLPSRGASSSTYSPSAGVRAPAPSASSSVGGGSVGTRAGGGAAAAGGGSRGGRGR